MNHSPLWTPERQLAQTGLGELRRFELYPGMELAMTSFHGERVQLEHEPLADVLEINYCRKGRIGWSMRGWYVCLSRPRRPGAAHHGPLRGFGHHPPAGVL